MRRRPTGARRGLGRVARPLAGLGVAAGLTAWLSLSATSAAFTARTGDTANQVSSAASFCTAAGTTVNGTIGEDAATSGANTGQNYNQNTMAVGTSPGADGYLYIRFGLPSPRPTGCKATSATLTLYAGTFQAASMSVYRATATWSETTLTWTNQPPFTGAANSTPVTGTSQAFQVADLVNDIYANTNYGFVVKDALTLGGGAGGVTRYQIYNSFSNPTNKPTLSITWG